jgi:type IV pilus assembly protein PilE
MRAAGGMTLLELLLAMALAGFLLMLPLAFWSQQLQQMRLGEARLALRHNARFLEQWYLKHGCYCAKSGLAGFKHAGWPPLPLTSTDAFHIEFGAKQAYGEHRYRLWARPRQARSGLPWLLMDQDGLIVECRRRQDLKSEVCDLEPQR